jgi:hypothetical protein
MPVPSQGHYVFTVFRLLTDFVCLYAYEVWLSLCKIVRSSVILLLPLFTPDISGVRVTRYLALYVIFCRLLLVLLSFFLCHCGVCPLSIYGFWLPLWYLETLLIGITEVVDACYEGYTKNYNPCK